MYLDPAFCKRNKVHGMYVDEDEPRIVLAKRPTTPLTRSVLLHEFLHAIDELYGMGWGERKVQTLEMALGQSFTPELRKHLWTRS